MLILVTGGSALTSDAASIPIACGFQSEATSCSESCAAAPAAALPVIVSNDDLCRTHEGFVKLKLVQRFYGLNINQGNVEDLVSLFTEWRDTVELLHMRLGFKKTVVKDFSNTPVDLGEWCSKYQSSHPGFIAMPFNDNPKCRSVCCEDIVHDRVNKKSVKRGNDVYIEMLEKKFKPLFKSKNHVDFFSTKINSNRKRVKRTRMLYLTGTCDHAITGDLVSSWVSFGAYWNHFITSLRDVFGSAAYIRTWQSQDNGYPHFHALVYFFDFEFSAVHWDPDDSWRIHNRQKVTINKKTGDKDYCRDVIKDLWRWGSLDVKCCDNSKTALRDLLKYVLRDLEGGASDLTNAMVWYFQKKSFAVSRSFMDLFGSLSEPDNDDLINAVGVIQEATQEVKLVSIDVFPLVPLKMIEKHDVFFQCDIRNWPNPPDPPGRFNDFFDKFESSCVPTKMYTRSDGVVVTLYKKAGDFVSDGVVSSDVKCPCCECGELTGRSILGVWICRDCYSY